ncbi:MAG: hypothetical protein DHS20C05_08470 [Hyphococcus sp.]|nr:MAG: hypothetical protein DHS20C05_08470 [Marinicaulis sp.]
MTNETKSYIKRASKLSAPGIFVQFKCNRSNLSAGYRARFDDLKMGPKGGSQWWEPMKAYHLYEFDTA